MQKVHYLQSYIILKDNSIKECILKTVGVNSGHCGRFIPEVVSWSLGLGEISSKRGVGILETFRQILWSCTLSNLPISNFLDMYLCLKHWSKNCWAISSIVQFWHELNGVRTGTIMLFYLTGYDVMCFKHWPFLFLDQQERVGINVDEEWIYCIQ